MIQMALLEENLYLLTQNEHSYFEPGEGKCFYATFTCVFVCRTFCTILEKTKPLKDECCDFGRSMCRTLTLSLSSVPSVEEEKLVSLLGFSLLSVFIKASFRNKHNVVLMTLICIFVLIVCISHLVCTDDTT